MAISERQLTLEQFLELPERKPALEFDEGMVTRKVAPKGQHSRLETKLAEWFNRAAEPSRTAIAFAELRTTFAGSSLVPDVSVYRWERIPRDAAGRVANDFLEPPDVAIEIVSPRQGVNVLVRRCLWYVAHGVPLALLVDPHDQSVIVFRLDRPAVALRGDDQIDFSDLFPGLRLAVQELFSWLIML
jgi:Uma2 family endonuclease